MTKLHGMVLCCVARPCLSLACESLPFLQLDDEVDRGVARASVTAKGTERLQLLARKYEPLLPHGDALPRSDHKAKFERAGVGRVGQLQGLARLRLDETALANVAARPSSVEIWRGVWNEIWLEIWRNVWRDVWRAVWREVGRVS